MGRKQAKDSLQITALSLEDLEQILAKSGATKATRAALLADIEAGVPTGPEGTVSLVNYAAWLVKEMSRGRN